VISCIRPNIVFIVPDGIRSGQHVAAFEVNLLPSGEPDGPPRMVQSSGIPAFDVAVERAIGRCNPFPRPKDGLMPRSLPLVFDPVDVKK
jgi:colicin import membrane protein